MDPDKQIEIHTVDMHTGGEPLRIITKGYPAIYGKSILEKRKYVMEHYDQYRTLLMLEPRGHFDMYGALLVTPDDPEADIGVLFLHNEGYSSMCGHAVIALGRYIVDSNISCRGKDDIVQRKTEGDVQVGIQCPCGLVRASVKMEGTKSGEVSFVSVPAFAVATNITVKTKKFGDIVLDIGYGGAFYALVRDEVLKLKLGHSSYQEVVDAATAVTKAVKAQINITHPMEEDLSFLYGTIVTDGRDEYSEEPTHNVCIFADRQVDRCPTGSGVTARIAVQYEKGLISLGQRRKFQNAFSKTVFIGMPAKESQCGNMRGVQVEVCGHAYYTGRSVFTAEDDDPLRNGFLMQ